MSFPVQDPTRRLDVVGALNHPWITANSSAPLPIIERRSNGPVLMDSDGEIVTSSGESGTTVGGNSHSTSTSDSVVQVRLLWTCDTNLLAANALLKNHTWHAWCLPHLSNIFPSQIWHSCPPLLHGPVSAK